MKIPVASRSSQSRVDNRSNPQGVSVASYSGTVGELIMVYLKGIILSSLTFGIYNFWLKVNVRKYLWSNVRIGGDSLSYHGTGKELFFGAIKFGFIVGFGGFLVSILLASKSIPVPIVLSVYFLGLAFLTPYALYLSRCFFLRRMEFRGVRFGMKNDARNYAMMYISNLCLTVVTLGLYFPKFRNEVYSFKINRTMYGERFFSYSANEKPLRSIFLKCWLLMLPTLGLSLLWYKARETSYQINNTRLGDLRMARDYRPWDLLFHELIFWGGLAVTFGLAAPWVSTWRFRYYVSHNAIVGVVPDAQNVPLSDQPSGMLESLAESVVS